MKKVALVFYVIFALFVFYIGLKSINAQPVPGDVVSCSTYFAKCVDGGCTAGEATYGIHCIIHGCRVGCKKRNNNGKCILWADHGSIQCTVPVIPGGGGDDWICEPIIMATLGYCFPIPLK